MPNKRKAAIRGEENSEESSESLSDESGEGGPRDPVILSIPPLYGDPMGDRIVEWARKACEEIQAKANASQIRLTLYSARTNSLNNTRVEIFLDSLFLKKPDEKPADSSSGRPRRIKPTVDYTQYNFMESEGMLDLELKAYLIDLAKRALGELGLGSKQPFYWSVLRVDPRAPKQDTHVDQHGDSTYWSIILPLTNHPDQGHTEFPDADITAFPNSAYAFDGNTRHFGTANHSPEVRYALMGVTHAYGRTDKNRHAAFPYCHIPLE